MRAHPDTCSPSGEGSRRSSAPEAAGTQCPQYGLLEETVTFRAGVEV